jgi:hypothetical protein
VPLIFADSMPSPEALIPVNRPGHPTSASGRRATASKVFSSRWVWLGVLTRVCLDHIQREPFVIERQERSSLGYIERGVARRQSASLARVQIQPSDRRSTCRFPHRSKFIFPGGAIEEPRAGRRPRSPLRWPGSRHGRLAPLDSLGCGEMNPGEAAVATNLTASNASKYLACSSSPAWRGDMCTTGGFAEPAAASRCSSEMLAVPSLAGKAVPAVSAAVPSASRGHAAG